MIAFLLGVTVWFLFLVAAGWVLHLSRLAGASRYRPYTGPVPDLSVSVIIPVVDEDPDIWGRVLASIRSACQPLCHQIIVVANGQNSEENAGAAEAAGFEVLRLGPANKRLAVAAGGARAEKDIAVILDSDTIVEPDSLTELLRAFNDPRVGGATPRHMVFDRHRGLRWLSDWLEDLRFFHTVKSQSVFGAVSCLPGRLFAMRCGLLKSALPSFINQRFFGVRCNTGDDRFLTSHILRCGYRTVYQSTALVHTDAPTTLSRFAQQRLRWSRSGFRESLLALTWIWRHPFMAFTVLGEIVLRWGLAVLLGWMLLRLFGVLPGNTSWEMMRGVLGIPVLILLILVSAMINLGLKQIGHFTRHPGDLLKMHRFFFFVSFVLTPVEFFGNLTCWRDRWMTRRTQARTADLTGAAAGAGGTGAEVLMEAGPAVVASSLAAGAGSAGSVLFTAGEPVQASAGSRS